MKSYAVVLLSAGVLGTVIGFAQSTKETSASHVAVAKAAARQEHTALFGLCRALEPAPPAERGPAGRDTTAIPSGPFTVACGTGQSVRQSLLRRHDGIFVLGRQYFGRDHYHRRNLRLFG